jgi:hypothetical protein
VVPTFGSIGTQTNVFENTPVPLLFKKKNEKFKDLPEIKNGLIERKNKIRFIKY